MSKFVLSPLAESDLEDVWNYISEFDEIGANRFIHDIAKVFDLLANNQGMGKKFDEYIIELRMYPFKKYQIFYFLNENGVEIYRVLHSTRDVAGEFEDYFEGLKA
jgi:toxin ParE1/3/4